MITKYKCNLAYVVLLRWWCCRGARTVLCGRDDVEDTRVVVEDGLPPGYHRLKPAHGRVIDSRLTRQTAASLTIVAIFWWIPPWHQPSIIFLFSFNSNNMSKISSVALKGQLSGSLLFFFFPWERDPWPVCPALYLRAWGDTSTAKLCHWGPGYVNPA